MKKTFEQRRLDAIKLKFYIFPTECDCCRGTVKLEKMWTVRRYTEDRRCRNFYYCQECMHSAEDVLKEIDNGEDHHGIVGLDEPPLPFGTNPIPTTPTPGLPGERTKNINNT